MGEEWRVKRPGESGRRMESEERPGESGRRMESEERPGESGRRMESEETWREWEKNGE